MTLDPVTRKVARRPMFIIGVLLLIGGIVPLVATILFLPESNAIGPGFLMWVCVPIGTILVWRASSQALQEWRQGK
jgi:hypothetical protein